MEKRVLTTLGACALTLAAGPVLANGFDRINVPPTYLFEEGTYVELRYAAVQPNVSGSFAGGALATGDIGSNYSRIGGAYKQDINDRVSFAIDFGQPHGIDIEYPTLAPPPLATLSGLTTEVQSDALTLLGRYKLNDRFSVFGGPRFQRFRGTVDSDAAGAFELDSSDYEIGFLLGVAFERPETATRLAITYTSDFEHVLETTSVATGIASPVDTVIRTPESLQIAFETGIAANTLLFATYRHSKWSDANLEYLGSTLTDFVDVNRYSLGVGRQVTEKLGLRLAFSYQTGADSPVGSLSPFEDRRSIALAARYQATENVRLGLGVAYTWLDDATTTAAGDFTGNDATSFGLSVGYNF
ncbi:MAG: outer membrane protein transport protein [Pseudomonadota bacterium]